METGEQARSPNVVDIRVVPWPPELARAWSEGLDVELEKFDIEELDKV